MIIFYTIEINDFKNISLANDSFFQLWYSVYSIRKIWGYKDKIIIYTNLKNKFILLKEKYKLDVRTIEEKYKIYSGKHGGNLGHSRVFLIPTLLEETSHNILYLDPDTGINKYAKDIKNHFFNREEPFACTLEWEIKANSKNQNVEKFIPHFYEKYKIDKSSKMINNGILYFPNNDFSKKIAKEVQNIYYEIRNDLDIYLPFPLSERVWFADMLAVTIVFNRYKLLDTIMRTPFDNESIIIHYYMNKYNVVNSKWIKFKNAVIKKYKEKKF